MFSSESHSILNRKAVCLRTPNAPAPFIHYQGSNRATPILLPVPLPARYKMHQPFPFRVSHARVLTHTKTIPTSLNHILSPFLYPMNRIKQERRKSRKRVDPILCYPSDTPSKCIKSEKKPLNANVEDEEEEQQKKRKKTTGVSQPYH